MMTHRAGSPKLGPTHNSRNGTPSHIRLARRNEAIKEVTLKAERYALADGCHISLRVEHGNASNRTPEYPDTAALVYSMICIGST